MFQHNRNDPHMNSQELSEHKKTRPDRSQMESQDWKWGVVMGSVKKLPEIDSCTGGGVC